MNTQNNSKLALVLRKLLPLFENIDIVLIASDTVWNIVLGVFPVKYDNRENQIMENNRNDSTAEKIDNIDQITEYAEYFLAEKPDFKYSNLESFSYALKQLLRYTSEDQQAVNSLNRLKDLYISFMTSYYLRSIKNGMSKSATENIRYFCKKILFEDNQLCSKLSNLYS